MLDEDGVTSQVSVDYRWITGVQIAASKQNKLINVQTDVTDMIVSQRTKRSVPERRQNLGAPSLPSLK